MTWREEVKQLEKEASFDIGIFWLEQRIKECPSELDAYLFLLFRLREMWLNGGVYWSNVSKDPLRKVKQEYYSWKFEYYMDLAQRYFAESYNKFAESPEYLYYAARILGHIPWYFGLQDEYVTAMEANASRMHYNILLEKADYYEVLCHKDPHNNEAIEYAQQLVDDPSLKEQLATKGAAGEYVIGSYMTWAKKVLKKADNSCSDY